MRNLLVILKKTNKEVTILCGFVPYIEGIMSDSPQEAKTQTLCRSKLAPNQIREPYTSCFLNCDD